MRLAYPLIIPIILISVLSSAPLASAATLHVPADHPTIQSCIDAAVSGQDECVVAPGTYNELINFLGKAITLRSSHGPEVTTIIAGDAHSYNFIANSDAFDGIHLLSLSFVDVKSENIGKLTMKGCTVIDSTFWHLGGQKWMNGCTVIGSTFFHSGSQMWIKGSNFQSSSVSADFGTLNIQDCVFQGSSEGAVEIYRSFITVERCMFLGNRGLFSGGAIRYYDSTEHPTSSLLARSNVFVGNSAPRGGAFDYGFHLSSNASNGTSTFTENQSDKGGSVVSLTSPMYEYSVSISWRSCVLWKNAMPIIDMVGEGNSFIAYSIVPPKAFGAEGAGVLYQDPLFVRPPTPGPDGTWDGVNDDYGDLRLQPGSPCINAGDPNYLPAPGETDLDGHARVLCGRVDMGAYEFGIGDFDCDQSVTLSDWADVESCITEIGTSYGPGCEALDFEYDGDVDLRDFAAWQNLFGQ